MPSPTSSMPTWSGPDSAASSATSAAGANTSYSDTRCTPPGTGWYRAENTSRRRASSTATSSAIGVAQRVGDEVEARDPDDGDSQRLRHHLRRGHADAQPREQAGPDAHRDRRQVTEVDAELAAEVVDGRARAAPRADDRRRAAPTPSTAPWSPMATATWSVDVSIASTSTSAQPGSSVGTHREHRARRRAAPTTYRSPRS